jgi:hypothetical protein
MLMGMATLLVCLALIHRSDGLARVLAAAVLALAFFTLPTQIHERYLFLALAPLMMSAAAAQPVLILQRDAQPPRRQEGQESNDYTLGVLGALAASPARRLVVILIAFLILMVSAMLNILGALRGFSEPAYAAIVGSSLPIVLAALNILILLALMGRLLAISLGWPRAARSALAANPRVEAS